MAAVVILNFFAVQTVFALPFKKINRERDPAQVIEGPQYRIVFSYDRKGIAKTGKAPGSKWVEFSYKYADFEEPPAQRFAGLGGGKVRFLDKDGFVLASDVFSIDDLIAGDTYGFLWVEENRARQIVSADAVMLRPEELHLLKESSTPDQPKINIEEQIPAVAEPAVPQSVEPRVQAAAPESLAPAPAPETETIPASDVSAEPPLPSPSPSPSPENVEAPLFPPAPSVFAAPESSPLEAPSPSVAPSPAADDAVKVEALAIEAAASPSPTPPPSAEPQVAEPSPSPSPSLSPETEGLKHGGMTNDDLRAILSAQDSKSPTTMPAVTNDTPPEPDPAAKEDDKNGVIVKQTFL